MKTFDCQKNATIQRPTGQRMRAVICATTHASTGLVDVDWTVALEESAP